MFKIGLELELKLKLELRQILIAICNSQAREGRVERKRERKKGEQNRRGLQEVYSSLFSCWQYIGSTTMQTSNTKAKCTRRQRNNPNAFQRAIAIALTITIAVAVVTPVV